MTDDDCTTEHDPGTDTPSERFGRWLLRQRECGGLVDAARADRTFPKEGDPEAEWQSE